MKRFFLIFFLLLFSNLVFAFQETGFSVCENIAICSYGYYKEHKTMPEKISDLLEKEYYVNTANYLKKYERYGFNIEIKKRDERTLDIFVNREKQKYRYVYTVEDLHHFERYINDKFIDEYFRDDAGNIIHLENEKKIQNDKEEDAEDYDDYVIIKDILML